MPAGPTTGDEPRRIEWPEVDLPAPALLATPASVDDAATAPILAPTASRASVLAAPEPVVAAAVDVGANSAHLLVAAVSGHRVEPLLDESAFLGLGDRVSSAGYLGAEARERLVETLAGYADAARRLGAREIGIVGTEPLRRAADAARLVADVRERAGVAVHVVDHAEEAQLTLLGVTAGKPVPAEVLVVDIGGGSSEFVIVRPDGPVHASGIPLGSATLTREHVRSDPPTLAEIDAMRAAVAALIVRAPEAHPDEIVAVGGTASNLLKLLPATAIDRLLTRRRMTVALAMLTVERSVEAAERHVLRPQRAKVLPAGALIVDGILQHYGVDRLRVSDEGVREGLVLAVAAAGAGWRDRLPSLMRGWTNADPLPVEA